MWDIRLWDNLHTRSQRRKSVSLFTRWRIDSAHLVEVCCSSLVRVRDGKRCAEVRRNLALNDVAVVLLASEDV